uniref:Serine/threonine-protein kinase sepA n=1 Tax=Rhizophora mucronata TaxID=61149 RepID=A0A2P2PKE4_RHIMU
MEVRRCRLARHLSPSECDSETLQTGHFQTKKDSNRRIPATTTRELRRRKQRVGRWNILGRQTGRERKRDRDRAVGSGRVKPISYPVRSCCFSVSSHIKFGSNLTRYFFKDIFCIFSSLSF